ncbi:hypothetical protein RB298_26505 [Priestia sp. BR_2]
MKKVDMVRHLNRAHTLFEKGEFHLNGHPVWIVFQYPNQFDEEWNRMMEQLKSDEELASIAAKYRIDQIQTNARIFICMWNEDKKQALSMESPEANTDRFLCTNDIGELLDIFIPGDEGVFETIIDHLETRHEWWELEELDAGNDDISKIYRKELIL